jgi:hypothetical protein
MSISPEHASHIHHINVGFDLTAPDLDPDAVSMCLGVTPHASARNGDIWRRSLDGQVLSRHPEGWWHLDSTGLLAVAGDARKDINEHLKALLAVLLPKRSDIIAFAQGGEAYFGVVWKSSYLYAGTGPLIEAQHLRGIADLKAGMGFDIYQVDDGQECEPDAGGNAAPPRASA